MIESSKNRLIKEIKSLSEKKYRDRENLFIADGLRFVSELPHDMKPEKMFFSESFAEKYDISKYRRLTDCYVISDRLFETLSETKTPQGIIAVCKKAKYNINDVVKKNGFYIIAEKLNDPGNLGTVIRTAHAAGADAVMLSKGSVDLYNPKVLRATMGSVFKIPVIQNVDLYEAALLLKGNGISIYAAHLKGKRYYYDLNLKKGCAFVLGNEAKGLSDEASEMCDCLVKIPMPGGAESLNASVAAAVLMYETVRQRKIGG